MTQSCCLHITNVRLPTYSGLQQILLDEQGQVQTIQPMTEAIAPAADLKLEQVDFAGDWLSPGGVDLQINGALGLAFPDLTVDHLDQLVKICRFLWTQGIDGFLPTIVTTSVEQIHEALEAIAQYQDFVEAAETLPSAAQILGVHLEGPFLNPVKRGAHPEEYLLPLTLDQVKAVLGDYASLVKVMTLAPELDDSQQVIPYLTALGITVSLGHSLATASQAQTAFEQGASMVTHAFNAMPGLHHRAAGLLGAGLVNPGVQVGFIADGQHISPTMLDMLVRTCRGSRTNDSYPNGLFLVSDALSPLGLPDGVYPWDNREICVTSGTARLNSETLAGTTLPLLDGAKNLVTWGICDPEEAIALATLAPRRALGLPEWPQNQPRHWLRWHHDRSNNQLTWQRW